MSTYSLFFMDLFFHPITWLIEAKNALWLHYRICNSRRLYFVLFVGYDESRWKHKRIQHLFSFRFLLFPVALTCPPFPVREHIVCFLLFHIIHSSSLYSVVVSIHSFISYHSFFVFRGVFGIICTIFIVVWCTYSATVIFIEMMKQHEMKYLVAYPVFLFFLTFALNTIF